MFTVKVLVKIPRNNIEETHYYLADHVVVGEFVENEEGLKLLEQLYAKAGQVFSYDVSLDSNDKPLAAKIVRIVRGDQTSRILTSYAWLMGPDGGTIDRLVP